MIAAAGIMGAAQIGSGLLGAKAAKKGYEQQAAMMAAEQAKLQANIDQAVKDLEAIGIPPVEAQRIALESPEIQGQLQTYQLGQSALEEVSTDPRLKQAQMAALRGMQEQGESGLTSQDKLERQELLSSLAAQQQAQQQSMLQDMASRGTLDSGAQIAAMLGGQQGSALAGQNAGLQLAADTENRRLLALQQAAGLAGSMEQQEYGQQSEAARAQDAIKQFDLANRMNVEAQNLSEKQRIGETGTAARNQQQMYNKELLQQDYLNRMQKATNIANTRVGGASQIAQIGMEGAKTAGQLGAAKSAGMQAIGSGVSSGAGVAGSYYSDKEIAQIKKK